MRRYKSNKSKMKAKKSLFLLGSILLHLLVLISFNISALGKKNPLDKLFELNSMKVANLVSAKAKNPSSNEKAKSKKRMSKKRKPSKAEPKKPVAKPQKVVKRQAKTMETTKTPVKRITNVAKQQVEKQVRPVKPNIQRKIVTTKQMQYKPRAEKQAVKLAQKRVNYKQQTKKVVKQIKLPQRFRLVERVTNVKRVTQVRQVTRKTTLVIKTITPRIQQNVWQQNITQKQVNKQLKPVKPTVQRKTVTTKQMDYKPREQKQPVKLAQKRVVYKQQTQKLNRQQIKEPKLLDVAKEVKDFKHLTQIKQVVKRTTMAKEVATPQIQQKVWQQNVTQKQVNKQLKPVQPNIQRQAVTKQQLEYERVENQPVKLVQKRVAYKQQTKELNREQVEEPQMLEVAEQVEDVKQVTQVNQVTKKTAMVNKVEPMPVLHTPEAIPQKTEFKKVTKQVKVTPQREVIQKEIKYEEKVTLSEAVEQVEKVVTYQQTTTEQNKRVITDAPEFSAEATPTESDTAQPNVTTIAKQEFEENVTYASTTPTLTQMPTEVSVEQHQEKAEKMTATIEPMTAKTMIQHKVEIQKTDTSQKQLAAFKGSQSGVSKNMQTDSISTSLAEESTAGSRNSKVEIEANLPPGNVTNRQLYKLTGRIDADVKTAFLTINNITQLVSVVDGMYVAEVALAQGVNNLSIMAFNGRGGMGSKSFKLLFNAPRGGMPTIHLQSPENGRQGVKLGETIMVEGTIDDPNITKATLLLNQIPIPMKVKNGRFRKKIVLPEGTVFVFRVMAKNQSGVRAFSPAHTVLSTYDIDILNPRPY